MPPRSRLSIAKRDIVRAFDEHQQRVFAWADIEQMLASNRSFWRLAQATTGNEFLDYLLKNTQLAVHKFELPHRPTNRYSWGDVSTFELVQSLREKGYFTHYTAIHLHGLTDQIPKTIYLNSEQKATGGGGQLSQGNIDRAFKRKPRVSKNLTTFGEQRVCLLNGQNTGLLGVVGMELEGGLELRVTNIERTLIDATVRPVYSGGVFEVAQAFSAAYGHFSTNKLVSYLRKLNYTYPYHQAIGFYLERTGKYSDSQIALLRRFEMEYDFYLAHDVKDVDYVKSWRLFVPKGF